jgi:hypothetical protein
VEPPATDDSEWVPTGSGGRVPWWLGDDWPDRLLIASPDSRRAMASVARLIPRESSRLAVVMDRAERPFMPELAHWLRRWVPQRWDSIRLVAASAAAAGVECAAKDLSEFLGVEVLAPDGNLVVVPDGSLFVSADSGGPMPNAPARPASDESGSADPDGSVRTAPSRAGAWWRFRPGRPPVRVGRRFPVPEWEVDIGEFVDPGVAGVVVEEIPCGLWLHRPARIGKDDFAFGVPVLADSMILLVSRPGDPGLRAVEVRRVVEALPEALCDRMMLVPYGDRPVADARLGAVASSAARRTVRLRNGLPLFVPGRGAQVLAIGPDGAPTWRPFARELAWRPHGGARVLSWIPPVDYLLPVGPGQLALDERWLVEVTESGLWVREQSRTDVAGLVRDLPMEAGYCTVVVGASGEKQVKPPWRAIVKLLRRLPDDARTRLRLAVPETAGNWLARDAAKASRRHFRDRPVALLTGDGSIAPWPPMVAAVPLHPAEPAAPPPPASDRAAAGERRDPVRETEPTATPSPRVPVEPVHADAPAAGADSPAVAADSAPVGSEGPAADTPAAPPPASHLAMGRDDEGDSLLSFLDEIRGIATPDSATDPYPTDASRTERDDTPAGPASPAPAVDPIVPDRRDDPPPLRYRPDELPGSASAGGPEG